VPTLTDIPPVADREHVVFFCDSDDELADRAGGHLAEAVSADVLVVAKVGPSLSAFSVACIAP
jgi:hypothetical protein